MPWVFELLGLVRVLSRWESGGSEERDVSDQDHGARKHCRPVMGRVGARFADPLRRHIVGIDTHAPRRAARDRRRRVFVDLVMIQIDHIEVGAVLPVVADEVRNLAMRATEAAEVTGGLIDGTARKVREGTSSLWIMRS